MADTGSTTFGRSPAKGSVCGSALYPGLAFYAGLRADQGCQPYPEMMVAPDRETHCIRGIGKAVCASRATHHARIWKADSLELVVAPCYGRRQFRHTKNTRGLGNYLSIRQNCRRV